MTGRNMTGHMLWQHPNQKLGVTKQGAPRTVSDEIRARSDLVKTGQITATEWLRLARFGGDRMHAARTGQTPDPYILKETL